MLAVALTSTWSASLGSAEPSPRPPPSLAIGGVVVARTTIVWQGFRAETGAELTGRVGTECRSATREEIDEESIASRSSTCRL